MSRRKVLAVVVPLGAVAVLAALVFVKQNPITYTEVRPDIVPIEPELVEIPAGSFLMGNPWGTPEEQPVREVHLSTYRIGKYEVTNEEYRRFCDATGRPYPLDPEEAGGKDYFISKPRHPVVMISWSDMAAYCRWLSDKTGKDYHLPTEAQWEKAARGGLDGKRYSWGDERVEGMARMMLDYYAGPVEVGSFPPNGYGLYDTAGNVNEAVADWYEEGSYAKASGKDPLGPTGLEAYLGLASVVGRSRLKGRCHIVRGGSWRAPWDWQTKGPHGMFETPVECGAREYLYQHPYTHFDLGFRVAEGGVWRR